VAIPSLTAIYFRLKLPETTRYLVHVEKNLIKAEKSTEIIKDKTKSSLNLFKSSSSFMSSIGSTSGTSSINNINFNISNDHLNRTQTQHKDSILKSFKDFIYYLKEWKNLKGLLSISMAWFCIDSCFYTINLNSIKILHNIGLSNVTIGLNDNLTWNFIFNCSLLMIPITLFGIIFGCW
jgi:hypothetical protein